MCKQCQVFGHSTTQCSKKLPLTTNHPTQEWTLVGNGKLRIDPAQPNSSTTLTASPTSIKPAINCPQAEMFTDPKHKAASHEWIRVGNGKQKTIPCDSLAAPSSPHHFNVSNDPTVIQVEECSESKVEQLEILGGASLTYSKPIISQVSTPTNAPRSGSCTDGNCPNSVGMEKVNALFDLKKLPALEPPDYQGLEMGEKAAILVSNEIIDPYQLLSKSARKSMRKQGREQPMGSLNNYL